MLAWLASHLVADPVDPRNFDQLFSIKSKWERAHPLPQATLAQVADHVEHVRDVAGMGHVGLGGDFDGTLDVTVGPRGRLRLPGPVRRTARPRLDRSRLRRPGRGNLLRALRAAESYAVHQRPASPDPGAD